MSSQQQEGTGGLCLFWESRAASLWVRTSMGSTFIMLCEGCFKPIFPHFSVPSCTEIQTLAVLSYLVGSWLPLPPTHPSRGLCLFLELTYPWDLDRDWEGLNFNNAPLQRASCLWLPRDKGQKAEAVFFGGVSPFTQRPARAREREREGTWPFLIPGSGSCSCSLRCGQLSGQRSVYGTGRSLHWIWSYRRTVELFHSRCLLFFN